MERFDIPEYKKGLDLYYKICPEFFCQDSIFSIKSNTFPHITDNNVNIIQRDVNAVFINKLKSKVPFSISRFNDGEWIAMLKIEYTGNSPHPSIDGPYNPKSWVWGDAGQRYVDERLTPIFKRAPEYYIGVSSQVFKKKYMSTLVVPYLNKVTLVDGGLFTRVAVDGRILAYFNALKGREVLVVGPPYCESMRTHVQFKHVVTNDKVWLEHDRVEREVEHHLTSMNEPVIIYACSFVAKSLIDIFYHKYGKIVTQLDFGSAVCPYSNVKLRTYHKYVDVAV